MQALKRMKKWIILALFLSACNGSNPQNVMETSGSPSIVGGTVVPYGDAITRKALSLRVLHERMEIPKENNTVEVAWKASQCTASAIAPRIILTAAHCVSKTAEIHRIEIADAEGKKQYFKVLKYSVHPDYEKDKNADVALMLLEVALPETIETLLLPPPKDQPLTFSTVKAAGFGRISGKPGQNEGLGILRTVDLNVLSYDVNEPLFVVDQGQGKGVCQGDSGGPAMIDINGQTYVVGVVSKTRFIPTEAGGDDVCAHEGVYANVQHFLDWIVPEMKKLSLE